MAMQISLYISSVLLAWFLWMFTSLVKNYWIARKIGLPMIISPATPLNPLWIICYRVFPQVLLLKHLPWGLGRWARCTFMGWTFNDKYALHDELGELFAVVSPGAIEVIVADPQAAHAVLARRKDYIKPAVMYEQLNVFGPNLNSVEGEDWQRHRRLTAPSFNEKTSSLVWDEASRQARDMVASWSRKGSHGTKDTVGDTATLALHVLTSAGFGVAYSFGQGVQSLSPGHAMTYKDSLSSCLQNIITFSIVPKRFLSLQFLPNRLRTLGKAAYEFQRYMEEMLAHERSSASGRQSGPGNLASALVQASDDAKQSMVEGKHTKLGLTDDEIFGNIFAYNLAGHETTANTVATALVLLAAHPQYQEWLTEEIDSVLGTSRDAWQYEKAFPRLHRCLAVMLETLRLYGSIVFIPKFTGSHCQEITRQGSSILLPPATFVNINVQALHTDPKTWGSDSLTWDPSRWITRLASTKESSNMPSKPPEESHKEPAKGTYIPWADGPRNCPGRKFAQVEFVSVIVSLFSTHHVKPVLSTGQNSEDAKKALLGMVKGSAISAITLQMQEPRKVALKWERRA